MTATACATRTTSTTPPRRRGATCARRPRRADGDGWWDGVLTYNRSVDYARRVWTAADRYAGAVAP